MLCLAIGCASSPTPTLDDIAKGYVQAALQLAQHQPGLVDAWRGDETWKPGPRVPVARVRTDIATLRTRLSTIVPHSARIDYLSGQLQALDLAAGRLLGEARTFADEVATAYGVPMPAVDPARLQAARETLARVLPGTGSLGERHAAFRRSISVPAARREDVLRAALDACRTTTREQIALPDDESIDLRLDVDSTWDGFARYQGAHRSRIEISGRSPLDVARALHLACHEAYPGHHTQDVLLDATVRRELRLQPAFGPHLLIAEGAAEVGADLALPPAERARLYREALLPRAGLPPAHADTIVEVETSVFTLETMIPETIAAYLDSRRTRDATLEALTNDAAVMDAESLLAFAERQRTRAVVYVLGRQVVGAWLAAHPGQEWRVLAELFSVRAFEIGDRRR
jgi:hypothetical protein